MALRIDWNLPAFTKIRKDPAMKAALRAAGQRVLDRCGPGYEMTEAEGRARSRVHVSTANAEGMRDNARNATLARASQAA